jgi:RNA polymerase sigma factor (sigma-70 family)
MNETVTRMTLEQDERISDVVSRERSRLRSFIRRRVPDPRDVEDILQEVFCELVEANRLLMPIEHVAGWLYRVTRNRIVDLFRRKRPAAFGDVPRIEGDDEPFRFEDLLPSPDDGPETLYERAQLVDELEAAIAGLPEDQRIVFVAHEIEGRSFKDIAEETGTNVNTLLSRKHYAVLRLRERLRGVYESTKERGTK